MDAISQAIEFLPRSSLVILAGTWIAYELVKFAYNVFFHPLRHIPGPKLAAATYIPEFWYDVVKFGRYTKRIQRMHEQYGMLKTFLFFFFSLFGHSKR
jgi:hypothetical protein